MKESSEAAEQATVHSAQSIGPLVGSLFSILIGFLYFWAHRSTPLHGDASGYHDIAQEIWTNGLFSKFTGSDYRTWGYPAFLGVVMRLASAGGASERWMIFLVQMALHLASVFGLRAALRRVKIRPWAVEAVFYTLLLHPFVLIYPFYMLTESLSLSLEIGALACSIALLYGSRGRLPIAAAAGLIAGYMIAVRPASVFILPVLVLAPVAIWFLEHPPLPRMLGIAGAILLGLVLPLIPQTRNNVVYYGKFTPLVAAPLARVQQNIGIVLIKYASSTESGGAGPVRYLNPFYNDPILADLKPALWYRRYPGRGAVTIALHIFNLLDQDLLFVYNSTLVPAYYPYVSVANFLAIALGLAGIGVGVASWRRRTPLERWIAAVALVMLASHLGLHSLFAVENRYGVAALIVLYAFAAVCCGWLILTATNRSRLLAGVFVIVFCASATWLSSWVRWQSPEIRAQIIQRVSTGSQR